ncbi:unnamed protein product [Ectocarpus sp. CCAP 1310/34]|nr:unnamed protein product [Ectocarpus sp. CCAP 1310/34]
MEDKDVSRTRRYTLSGSAQRPPFSPLSPVHRSCIAPEEGCREGEGRWNSEAQETQPAEARTGGDLSALEQEEWVKVSWKKGECREEIKLIAEASGLAFDDARIVALRLYNHFNWLLQLQERSEQLLVVIGRERRLFLTLVRNEALALSQASATHKAMAGRDEAAKTGSYGAAEGGGCDTTKEQFNRYVKGMCVVCNEGSFDQVLDLLFRAYSTARDDCTITRNEMAAILSKHVVYEDSEGLYLKFFWCVAVNNMRSSFAETPWEREPMDITHSSSSADCPNVRRHQTLTCAKTCAKPQQDPTEEKDRVYRWLKRQFVHLAPTTSRTTNLGTATTMIASSGHVAAAGKYQEGGGCVSWDSARELLRRGPQRLMDSLAVDLPCLSKDLWSADLVDLGRTNLMSSLQ